MAIVNSDDLDIIFSQSDETQSNEILSLSPPSPPSPLPTGRGQRKKRPTWKLLEQLPQPPPPLLNPPTHSIQPTMDTPLSSHTITSLTTKVVHSAVNLFGIFREYTLFPSHDPEDTASSLDFSDLSINSKLVPLISSPFAPPVPHQIDESSPSRSLAPFSSWSLFALINWMWTGSH